MTIYKLHRSKLSDEISVVIKNPDAALRVCIPFNPANTDYQEYLEWLAEGNEPLPADD